MAEIEAPAYYRLLWGEDLLMLETNINKLMAENDDWRPQGAPVQDKRDNWWVQAMVWEGGDG